ncbi:MAG TPA: vitamin K epoxide reductase family protein [Candidatus Saccharibacteria bacterium]|nr:vitamin K epoxide reductase family protein [Candidatus Saccharibacteria bacterium]
MDKLTKLTLKQVLPYMLIIFGAIGLIAAFILTMEKMTLLSNPNYQPSCNLNPVLSCGSIIRTDEASAFGFPNPFIGLAGYSVVITIGVGLLAGATFKKWFWKGLNIGALLGFIFIHWLFYESLYDIGALCIYCMVVWAITAPLFWYTTLYNLREGNLSTPKKLKSAVQFANKHHLDILITWYMLIILAIITNFWYYWKTLI